MAKDRTKITFVSIFGSIAATLLSFGLGEDCSNSNRTTYVRSSGSILREFSQATVNGLTLTDCTGQCTSDARSIKCRSFDYDEEMQSCSLYRESSQPFGPSELTTAVTPETAFYQQICVPSSELCQAPFSFERLPQRVLLGHALEVVTALSVSDCLKVCLEAFDRYRIECKSVMYYYETKECILNEKDRSNRPELFSNDTQGFIVDYFENHCLAVNCFSPMSVHLLKSTNYALAEQRDVIISDTSRQRCATACLENSVDGVAFACKSFMYDSQAEQCFLAAGAALPRGRFALTTVDRVDYYEKICLSSKRKCRESEGTFARFPDRLILGHADEVRQVDSLSLCLDLCLEAPTRCLSVMYFYEKGECIMNDVTRHTSPEMFTSKTRGIVVDYFENICKEVTDEDQPAAVADSTVPNDNSIEEAKAQGVTSVPVSADENMDLFGRSNDVTSVPRRKIKGTLETECRFDGVFVHVSFSAPTSGSVFVKNKYRTCRVEFVDSDSATLALPFPGSPQTELDRDCGRHKLGEEVWSYMVVVQKNGMGIPGLMTSSDRLFNITCDYTDTTSTDNSERDNSLSPTISMSIERMGQPVTTVLLGEQLDVVWKVRTRQRDVGFFIRECTAERVGGSPPTPSPVKLITDGCPDAAVANRIIKEPIRETAGGFSTKMLMFRFDGSRHVRIRCNVDMCVQRCNMVKCEVGRKTVSSMGRKKRGTEFANGVVQEWPRQQTDRAFESILSSENGRQGLKINSEVISGTFTIVDKLHNARFHDFHDSDQSSSKKPGKKPSYVHKKNATTVCMIRPIFMGLIALLTILSLVEGSVIFLYFYAKYYRKLFNRSPCRSTTESGRHTACGGSVSYGSAFYASIQRLIESKMGSSSIRFDRKSHSPSSSSTSSFSHAEADDKMMADGKRSYGHNRGIVSRRRTETVCTSDTASTLSGKRSITGHKLTTATVSVNPHQSVKTGPSNDARQSKNRFHWPQMVKEIERNGTMTTDRSLRSTMVSPVFRHSNSSTDQLHMISLGLGQHSQDSQRTSLSNNINNNSVSTAPRHRHVPDRRGCQQNF